MTSQEPSNTNLETLPTGMRVLMRPDHPWSGHSGEVVRWESTPFGIRPVIRLDNGMECFALKTEHFLVLDTTQPVRGRRRSNARR